ncbi:YhgE/Pip domain-containing protein [Bacillus sp. 03113]|uniref:YhgE/Pip domain-containing protein n=1 Tax=Bacillus sp. 03113 TaxID=2578211 RepID=UPI0011425C61|nr:YhgE/Pip domain-containing protein [Bacillus sp. 03113]
MKNRLFISELKAIFHHKMLLISIIAILFVPILYSGMYLWAFWDPYGHLDNLPVAVVNQDIGAELDGQKLKLGEDLAANLKKSEEFHFSFVEKESGYRDLKKQNYYLLIDIPKNFSENATTLMDQNPKKLDLVYVTNPSYNFISSQIGKSAIERIKEEVAKNITETYAQSLFQNMDAMSNGLKTASDGAGQLNDGAAKLKDGTVTLYDKLSLIAEKSIEFDSGVAAAGNGTKQLVEGTQSLTEGLGQLEAGHNKLSSASEQLKAGDEQISNGISKTKDGLQEVNGKLPELIQGTGQLQAGATNLHNSLQSWQDGAAKASQGAKELSQGAENLQTQLNQMMPMLASLPDENKQQLIDAMQKIVDGSIALSTSNNQLATSAGQLAAGGGTLSSQLVQVNEGQKQLQYGLNQLANGSTELDNGVKAQVSGQQQFVAGMSSFDQQFANAKEGSDRLLSGASGLLGGMNKITAGSGALKEGTDELSKGAKQLSDGNTNLWKGADELTSKLQEGANEASQVHSTNKTYQMMAEPVQVKNHKIADVPNYGTGLAPYFLSLGLFVGALMFSIVFPFKEPIGRPQSGLQWFMSKFTILIGVGTLQSLIATFILLVCLGIKVQSAPLFILFTFITSLTFMAVIQFLVTLFDNPGRFIAVIILIFQLTTSAGTFPLELIPNFLQKVHAFLPMTYSVSGLRSVISSGDIGFMWHNAGFLGIYAVLFIGGTIIYFHSLYKRRYSEA